nr:D-glucuronyl C5-epimerase family protein [Bacteroidia bacterium]
MKKIWNRVKPFFNLKIVISLTALLMLSLLFQSTFLASPQNELKIPEPTKDFSFIKRFYCISDLFGKEQWHNNKGRSFDDEGIHLTNSKPHPVNACHYALFCYDEYIRTGEEAMKEGFLNQVKYLLDSNSYHQIDEASIAYPYNINFHDLKPPWYSALAQSEAISVLVRYYALTKDRKALPVLVQLKNFMVTEQEGNCGTKSITPEGNIWYEEYPNSKQERQVLNGFLLATVALYEYSHLFPEDTESQVQYKNTIKSIKESFKFYDTGSWLKYNRGDQRQV